MLDPLIDLIIKQEKQLLARIDPPAVLIDLIDDEFLEIGGSSAVHDKAEVMDWLMSGGDSPYSGTFYKAYPLSDDIILLTYRSSTKDAMTGETKQAMRSSLWRLKEGKWRMVFHQGTPLKDAI